MKSTLSTAVLLLAGVCAFDCPAGAAEDGTGSLVSQAPMPGAPAGASAWRIRYRSKAQDGAIVEITGVVVAPTGPAPKGGRNIVAWAHGTVGIAETCAPTQQPKLFENIGGLKGLLEAGDVVVATDYQGLGTRGPSPFMVGVSSGRAVLDSVRAARAIPETAAGDKVVTWGESQGAHAAMWAAQIARSYAPELHVVGVGAAAPPTNLVENFKRTTDTLAHALLTSFTTQAYANVYGIQLSTFSNGIGQDLIHRLAKDCLHADTVDGLANIAGLILTNQVPHHVSPEWGRLLQENTPALVRAGDPPLLIAQGSKDVVITPQVTHAYAVQSCQAGGRITYIDVNGGDHTAIIAKSAGATLPWIADRFAGRPAPSDCKSLQAEQPDR